ncbi:MAG: efflux RND transporter periplasmic adaptor subunit [Ignavibacteriales bacterium]|jgi:membrane fusion protein (multidrug efflux system)|nr:efflux RND transporter periplasmic adaptor subunit [Ignavibacteriales bacterium]MBP7543254.1 efflux RND transporter periplasmic adaptor subunit [Ignavibacteriaceae bacterium]MBP9123310.1 efflux RND transporter periplasmic adaptor subunit [Ignavibacteriaceae bacterium]MCC6637066.1 efflux RND transporter periplasmic adaptor subunit [Ignavibacteriaceae bacterium]
MAKKTKIIIYSVIALIICTIIVYPLFTSGEKKTDKGKSTKSDGPAKVKGKILKFDSFASEIKVMGKVIADEWVDLSPEVAGKITKIYFKEGSSVAKGQLLVKINDSELQAQLKKNDVKLQLAAQNLDRQKKLLELNGTSQEQYDNSVFEYRSIEADIDLLKAQIAKTEIRAPFSGQIGLRYVSEGAFATPGVKIATLQNKSALKIDFTVPQNYSIYMKEGRTISFTTGNEVDPLQAKIYAIEPGVDQQTATLKVRAYVSGRSVELIPGKVVEVLVSLSAPVQTILISSETLVPEISGYSVFMYKAGKAVSIPVQTGDRNEKVVQILGGIAEGDTMIVSGLIQLRNNSPVKLTEIVK